MTSLLIGITLILLFLAALIRPRRLWRLQVLGARWMFADPDRLQPSGCGLAYARSAAVIGLSFGVAITACAAHALLVAHEVDTTPGTAGAYAAGSTN
jgi:hypothetical protein